MRKFSNRFFPLFFFLFIIVGTLTLITKPVKAANPVMAFKHVNFQDNTITTSIFLNTSGNKVNGVTADFTYPSDILKVTDLNVDNSLFSQFIEKDFSKQGKVYISCYALDPVQGEGTIATITFEVLTDGTANLNFTRDVAVLDANTSSNILGPTEVAEYKVKNNVLEALPQTGTKEVISYGGLVAFILLVIIVIFAIAGFTIWGGVYFSLGKWEIKGEYRIGKPEKNLEKKQEKAVKKVVQRSKKK
jgi:hypothetical protein